MPRFFITEENFENGKIVVRGEDANHISHSLRMKISEKLTLCDLHNLEYECEIEAIDSQKVTLKVLSEKMSEAEPTVDVHLFQALPKGDKAELIIQKCVELGVKKITFFLSSRCISRPDMKSFEKKLERYNKISQSAAKQCSRAYVPEIAGLISFEQAAEKALEYENSFLCYECEPHLPLGDIIKSESKSFAVIIGSEGGFERAEAEYAFEKGIALASLGKRILRTETAPICVLSAIMFSTGNMN